MASDGTRKSAQKHHAGIRYVSSSIILDPTTYTDLAATFLRLLLRSSFYFSRTPIYYLDCLSPAIDGILRSFIIRLRSLINKF